MRQFHKMWFGLSVVMMFMLAGCFRPSGEANPSTPTPADLMVIPSLTPELPPTIITNTDPTDTPLALLIPTSTPTSTPFIQATFTPNVAQTQAAGGQSGVNPTPSLIFITPGGRLDFITPDDPTETPIRFVNVTPGAPTTTGDSTPIPPDIQTDPSVSIQPEGVTDDCIYVVEAGDTLYGIALFVGVTLTDMRAANPDLTGENPILQIDQELNIPVEGCPGYTPPEVESVDATPTDDLNATSPFVTSATTTSLAPGESQTYTVQAGDTLFTIAREFGVTVADIVRVNNLTNPDQLSIGQILIIPGEDDIATPITPLPTVTPRRTPTVPAGG